MRKSIMLLATASCFAVAMPAHAASFIFSFGNYVPGVTSPTPLLAPDTLDMTTNGSKSFSAVTFTNQSGTVNWTDGAIFLGSGTAINNQSLWNMTSDDQIANLGGATSTFTNTGIFRKSGGAGASNFGSNAFVNSGTIDAQTGRIAFGGGSATFNAGSIFTGAGEVDIGTSTFNGGFTSSNVDFEGGTYTGNAAALTGTADWMFGTFTGSWTINSGSTLTALSSSKILSGADFTNNGTVNWQDGDIFIGSASQLVNNGTITATSDNNISNLGGATSTFTNNGTFRKSGDAGTTIVGTIAFINDGTIDSQAGSIAFGGGNVTFNAGSIFTGSGQVDIGTSTFNGGFTSSNVDFEGGTFTGNAAALTGTADWLGGTFTGSWTINSGSTLTALSSSKLLSSANFNNNGTVNWQDGDIFIGSASQLVNNGTITATGDNNISNLGGAASNVINNGLIEKTSGTGTTTLSSSTSTIFDNNGTINVLSGTIALPTAFTNDGTLGGTGTFASTNLTNGGIIAPGPTGATGTLSLTGNYAQAAFGTLNTQLASTGSFDLFNISGTASLNGTLALSCILSCAINTGDSFVILNSVGNLSGTFANVTTSGFLNGFAYNVIYDYTADLVRLNVTNAGTALPAVPEPSTWAMMLFGFGLIGSTLRRRNATRASATV
jgi:PEP-CTERM motif